MANYSGEAMHHLILFGIQVTCLVSLGRPYWSALKADQWNDYLMDKSWGLGRFTGDFGSACLLITHLLIWADAPNAPAELAPRIITLLYGWTSMLAIWTIYRHQKTSNIKNQSEA